MADLQAPEMTFPAFLLGFLFVGFYASLFHLIRGGSGARWLLYFALSGAGFAFGQWVGASRGWTFLDLGSLELGLATVGSYLFLGVGEWLRAASARNDRV
jgi:hypothetical protein